ncbi:MAG: MscL family protein, partial [Deltaproteobacteria bacterium]|nr:MscL family protein [Deltaproteobacteria bacterium]
MANEFKRFALRGSVIDLAVGFTVGAAFSSIAQSLVGDVIMPPLGLAIGSVDFSNLFLVL